jgi:hypothetical protein
MLGCWHSRLIKKDDRPLIEKRILNQGLSLKRGLGTWHNMH